MDSTEDGAIFAFGAFAADDIMRAPRQNTRRKEGALQCIVSQSIIIAGIVIAILSSKDNIFSAPEYSPNKADGRNWGHAIAHVVAMLILPIISWLIGCLIMFITKKVTGRSQPKVGAARA